jgi:hypothetical protein
VVQWHWRCVLERVLCTVPLGSGSRGRVVLESSSSRPRLLLRRGWCFQIFVSPAELDLLWPRRSSVASPVESESSASSNSRTAMQGREDRETRNNGLLACNISCLGQKRRDVRVRALRTEIRAESRIEWINQCSVGDERGNGGSSASNVCTYAPARRLVYRRQLLFPHKGWA